MIALILAGMIAASAPDVQTRVPGTELRIGLDESRLLSLGTFSAVNSPEAHGMRARQGELKFFGIPCKATLFFREGRLARAHLEASGVAAHALAYVEDQLRRQRYWQECKHFEPGYHVCDWIGPVKVHLETLGNRLDARVELAGEAGDATSGPAATHADSTHAAPAAAEAARDTLPPHAATAATGTPTAPGPTIATPGTGTPSVPASGAIAAAPDTGHVARAGAPATPAPSMSEPVATLPETLKISLTSKNSPADWPRIVSAPHLEYPESARRESVQGVVWVLAFVDVDGSVRSAQIDRGIKELNDAALEYIRKSHFAPCARGGHPCRFWVRVAVRYTLF